MKRYRKYITVILLVLFMMILSGCGDDGFFKWVIESVSGEETSSDSSSFESDDVNKEKAVEDSDAGQEEAMEDSDADRQDLWEGGATAVMDGNSLTYGPLSMEIPDGFFLAEETENSITFNEPSGYIISVTLTKDSYQSMSDWKNMNNGCQQQLGSIGMKDIALELCESIDAVDGYPGYEVGIRCSDQNGKKLIMYSNMFFKSADEGIVPMLIVQWGGNDEVPSEILNSLDGAFNSIRLK